MVDVMSYLMSTVACLPYSNWFPTSIPSHNHSATDQNIRWTNPFSPMIQYQRQIRCRRLWWNQPSLDLVSSLLRLWPVDLLSGNFVSIRRGRRRTRDYGIERSDNNRQWLTFAFCVRIFFRQPSNHVRIVCLATSSSIIYSNSSRASNSSNWRAFRMSTERYDNMLRIEGNNSRISNEWLAF